MTDGLKFRVCSRCDNSVNTMENPDVTAVEAIDARVLGTSPGIQSTISIATCRAAKAAWPTCFHRQVSVLCTPRRVEAHGSYQFDVVNNINLNPWTPTKELK
jgi:hypothetical protein